MYYVDMDKPIYMRIKFDSLEKTAEQIGITRSTLSRILKGKQATKKTTAYCITKAYNPNAEILDYFVQKGE